MRLSTLASILLLTACASPQPVDRSLYEKLGEKEGIARVVDNLLFEIAEDEKILPLFAKTDIERFRTQLIDQLCEIADGPCDYGGDTMENTHRGMNITRAQFNSLVEDLIDAMEAAGLPTGTQNALLERLVPLYSDITGL